VTSRTAAIVALIAAALAAVLAIWGSNAEWRSLGVVLVFIASLSVGTYTEKWMRGA
jgi:hypothetical protein